MSINIKCRCGDSTKTFLRDIGPFFIGECCEEKGYDAQGNLNKVEVPALPISSQPTIELEVPKKSKDKKKKSPPIEHGQD